jgi:2-iminobutanoate/2-iminopropanoate deaminase
MRIVRTDKAPLPVGSYSQGVLSGSLVFTSGQLGIDPETGRLHESFELQVIQALRNLEAILNSAGASRCSVLKVTVYLKDMSRFQHFNKLYSEFFSKCPALPARSVVEVSRLPLDAQVEVECIAQRG